MNLEVLTRLEKFTIDHSPAILTTVGVVGTVTTAILTGKATYDAVVSEFMDGYETSEWENARDLTPKDRIKRHWKRYIPAVGTGALTVTAIVSANRIGTRRAAGIAAAFTLSEKLHSEYKDHVAEKFGVNKERELRDEVAQARVANTSGSTEVIVVGTEVLCLDEYSGRYFKSDYETIRRAENEINHEVNNNSYASLTDFYNKLGLDRTKMSDEVGWNTERMLKVDITSALTKEGKPCLAVSYNLNSNRDYWRNR